MSRTKGLKSSSIIDFSSDLPMWKYIYVEFSNWFCEAAQYAPDQGTTPDNSPTYRYRCSPDCSSIPAYFPIWMFDSFRLVLSVNWSLVAVEILYAVQLEYLVGGVVRAFVLHTVWNGVSAWLAQTIEVFRARSLLRSDSTTLSWGLVSTKS